MANILDYIDWRGDITFDQSPFNEIDNLIFSQISYVYLEGIVPAFNENISITLMDAVNKFIADNRHKNVAMGMLVPNHVVDLFIKMSESIRFRNIHLSNFINEIDYDKQQQFAAITITMENDLNYIAFRGTDDTIVGWKEDFNMGYMKTVPSQISAVNYVNTVSPGLSGSIMVGGHSKGGNLAVYSSVYCENSIKDRIIQIYNNDGPGFTKDIMETNEYKDICDRITTIVPESSVVGMLLQHEEKYSTVRSTQSGLLQHDAFSWEVIGTKFILAKRRTAYSEITDMALRTWLNGMDDDERILFVDTLFDLLESTDETTLTGLNSDKLKTATILIKTLKNMEEEKRNGMYKIVGELFKDSARAFTTVLSSNHEKKIHSSDKHPIKKVIKLKK